MSGVLVMLMMFEMGQVVMVRVGIGVAPALWGDGLGEPLSEEAHYERVKQSGL